MSSIEDYGSLMEILKASKIKFNLPLEIEYIVAPSLIFFRLIYLFENIMSKSITLHKIPETLIYHSEPAIQKLLVP